MDLISELRNKTADIHKKLESTPVNAQLLAETVSSIDYYNYLSAFHRLYSLIEKQVYCAASDFFLGIEQNQRLLALEKDLAQLEKKFAISPTNGSQHQSLPEFNGVENIGALYVLEGSRLGGRMILNHLKSTLSEDFPQAFLSERPVVSWATFLTFLQQIEREDYEKVIQAAIRMFKFVNEVLNQSQSTDLLAFESRNL